MKLIPKAKPVKIRIKSGGEEHSSLDSLKHNFSVDDLHPLQKDGRLSRWLKQLNENDLAEKVGKIDLKELMPETYVKFIRSFFEDYPDDITKICDNWLESYEYHNNGLRLLQYALNNYNHWDIDKVISIKDKYGKDVNADWTNIFNKSFAGSNWDIDKIISIKDKYGKDVNADWTNIFNKSFAESHWDIDKIISVKDKYGKDVNIDWVDAFKKGIAECHDEAKLFSLGKKFYENEDKLYFDIGSELLKKLQSQGNVEADNFLESNRNVTIEEIKEIRKMSFKFSTLSGIDNSSIDDCLKVCRSKKSRATVKFINYLSDFIKGRRITPYCDEYYNDEILYVNALYNNMLNGYSSLSCGSYFPYLYGFKKDSLSGLAFKKTPKVIKNIESNVYGTPSKLALGYILLYMVSIAVAELSEGNNTKGNFSSKPQNANATSRLYCNVILEDKGMNEASVANILKCHAGFNLSEAKEKIGKTPCLFMWNILASNAEAIVEELKSAGAKAHIEVIKDNSSTESQNKTSKAATNGKKSKDIPTKFGNQKEKSNKLCAVYLYDPGTQKSSVVKILEDLTGCSWNIAKSYVDAAPRVIIRDIDTIKAEKIVKKLKMIGAKAYTV